MERVIRLLILFLSLLLFSGCDSPFSDKSSKVSIIKVCTPSDPETIKIYQGIRDVFNKEHQDIQLMLFEPPAGSYHEKLLTMIAGGSAPDVMLHDDEPLLGAITRGAFLDITPFINRDDYDLSDFFPCNMELAKYKGKIYGLSPGGGPMLIVYNKDIFDKEGIEHPSDDWSWDDFLYICKKLTKDTDNDGRIDQFAFQVPINWWPDILPWIWSNGGRIFNEDKTECLSTMPQVVSAINFYIDLVKEYNVAPTQAQTSGIGNEDTMFLMSKLAMQPTGPWSIPYYRERVKFRWGAVRYPKGKAGQITRFTGPVYVIWAGTKHPDEAWEVIKYLVSPHVQKMFIPSGLYVPSRKSIANSDYVLRGEIEKKFIEAMNYARVQPLNPKWPEISNVINSELELTILGKQNGAEMAEKIKRKADVIFKEK